METVNIHEAKTQLSRLLERAHSGEEIIIAKAGKPYARLCPLVPPSKRELGFADFELDESFFNALPEEELSRWK